MSVDRIVLADHDEITQLRSEMEAAFADLVVTQIPDGSVTNAKVASNAAIAQSKIAGLVQTLADMSTAIQNATGAVSSVNGLTGAVSVQPAWIQGLRDGRTAMTQPQIDALRLGQIYWEEDIDNGTAYVVRDLGGVKTWWPFASASHHATRHLPTGADPIDFSAVPTLVQTTQADQPGGYLKIDATTGKVNSDFIDGVSGGGTAQVVDTTIIETEAALGPNAVFVGEPRDTEDYFTFRLAAKGTQSLTIKSQYSDDGLSWSDQPSSSATSTSVSGKHKAYKDLSVAKQYHRIHITNGSTAQATLRATSKYE